MRQVKSFDFDALGERERDKLLIGTVVPRPFAPTVDELVEAGLTAVPGRRVAIPWISEVREALR